MLQAAGCAAHHPGAFLPDCYCWQCLAIVLVCTSGGKTACGFGACLWDAMIECLVSAGCIGGFLAQQHWMAVAGSQLALLRSEWPDVIHAEQARTLGVHQATC